MSNTKVTKKAQEATMAATTRRSFLESKIKKLSNKGEALTYTDLEQLMRARGEIEGIDFMLRFIN